ncbi:MAG: 5'-3' exonuclease [Oscillospiraceae bacterium]|nr:5'-3' exonuclease [Oscillospiraceae bacterium]
MRLLIIDGSNLLFQMYYGMPARITGKNGRAIHGTMGFIGAMLKMIRLTAPTHLAVLFDGETSNPRTGLDEDYKANSPDFSAVPEEETPFSQLPDIYAALDHLHIAHAETEGCEFDDWAAGYARTFGSKSEVIIASFDSDFFQLITDRVSVLRYRGEKSVLCTPEYIREKFGITPIQYAAFKALTGDKSDNIRGVPKVGPKTAAALLKQFGTLENILAHPEEITKPSLRESIIQNSERIRLNDRLIRLEGGASLPFPIEKLIYIYDGAFTRSVLTAIGLI